MHNRVVLHVWASSEKGHGSRESGWRRHQPELRCAAISGLNMGVKPLVFTASNQHRATRALGFY